ncbi:MAG: hypothetical protein AB2L12_17550 [Smithellaceae bacterium]
MIENENNNEITFDDLLGGETSNKSGIYLLWLAVMLSAFLVLKNNEDYTAGAARSFIFEDNSFFDHVADGLGYEPAALRERIQKALKSGQE